MNPLAEIIKTIRLLTAGVTMPGLAAFVLASIPIFIQGIQFLFFTVINAIIHFIGSMRMVGGGDAQANLIDHTGNGEAKATMCPYSRRSDQYPYIAPKEGDDRSPCPALNTLANHGFLPRNGRGLTATILMKGLQEGYNLSTPLAAFLGYGGVLLLGQVVGFGADPSRDGVGFSLHDLARHNRTEHDASITHPNTPAGDEYAPIQQDPALFDAFVKDARPAPGPSKKGVLSYGTEDIARVRIRREAEPGTRIDAVRQEIARGETALVLGVFGFLPSGGNAGDIDEGELPEEVLGVPYRFPLSVIESWWKEERLPTPDWVPVRQTTLLGTFALQGQIRKEMQELRAKDSSRKYS